MTPLAKQNAISPGRHPRRRVPAQGSPSLKCSEIRNSDFKPTDLESRSDIDNNKPGTLHHQQTDIANGNGNAQIITDIDKPAKDQQPLAHPEKR